MTDSDPLDTPEIAVDTDGALARVRARIEREGITPIPSAPRARATPTSPWLKGLAAAASVVVVATALTVTGAAESIFTIFEPKQIVAVPITTGDLAGAPGLGSYGTLEWSTPPKPYDVPDLATAARESGLVVLTPTTLPAGADARDARFAVMPRTTATYTFSAEKTRGSAAAQGKTPPPMPANIDGSKLFITGGPAVVQYWDGRGVATGPSGATTDLSTLIVAQGKPPVVRSDGVTVDQLLDYLLAQPGISPRLAAQIRAIKEPSSTLPIPIPVDLGSSKQVSVQGTTGIFVGDSTGLGSAVIWQKDGIVYGVAGTLTEAELLAVANSLR